MSDMKLHAASANNFFYEPDHPAAAPAFFATSVRMS